MIGLNIAVLTAAATSIGIFDGASLTAHLGRDITLPPSMALVALMLDRLPVTLGSVVDLDARRENACSSQCIVRASLLP